MLACFEDFQVLYTSVWQGWQALDPTYLGGSFSMPVAVIAITNMAIQVKIKNTFSMFTSSSDFDSIVALLFLTVSSIQDRFVSPIYTASGQTSYADFQHTSICSDVTTSPKNISRFKRDHCLASVLVPSVKSDGMTT